MIETRPATHPPFNVTDYRRSASVWKVAQFCSEV